MAHPHAPEAFICSRAVSLLDRQLLVVTGKGGVGKTTVAAAAGLAAAARGRRVVVAELAGQARVPALLGEPAGRPGEEVPVADGLWATTLDPLRALEEWLGRVLGSRALTQLLGRSNFFAAFVGAAPGAAELVTITKAWELAQAERWTRGRDGYDLVVLDAPASGHVVGLLRTPGTFRDIARVGPIAAQAGRVRAFLADPARSGVLAVALAAEMPVSETLELAGRLDAALGRRLEAVVVNAMLPDRFTAAEDAAVAAAAAAGPADAVLAAHGVHGARARAREQGEQVARLREHSDALVAELPFVVADRLTGAHVHALAGRLGPALAPAAP